MFSVPFCYPELLLPPPLPRCWVSPRQHPLLLCHWSTLWRMGLSSLMAPLPQISLVSCQLSWWATSSSIHHLSLLSVSYNLRSETIVCCLKCCVKLQEEASELVLVFSWEWFVLQIQIRFNNFLVFQTIPVSHHQLQSLGTDILFDYARRIHSTYIQLLHLTDVLFLINWTS